ncbi:MAG: hypothetical protein B7733_20280, partial [Myxococcales bacterium FL481]
MVMAAPEPLDPPRTLGNITLLARLGEGGMAEVYLGAAGKGPFARLAAVKLLRPDASDREYRTRFLDEAKVVVKLHHNNLVDVRAAGELDGKLYIAMEAIQGRDLADIWDRCAELKRAFPVPLAVHLTREILRGLHYAHTFPRLGLVHRDVSPSNILVDWEGAIRLADFGLATSSLKGSMTAPGVVYGKVAYMCPEQAKGEMLDARADIYACGVVLWELLTGRPMRGREELNTDAVSQREAPAPSTLSQRVDPAIDAIVLRALARDRARRFPDAAAMLNALSQWLARNAPETSQDSVAEFLAQLFGDAAAREQREREALLRRIGHRRSTQVFEGNPLRQQAGLPSGPPPRRTAGVAATQPTRASDPTAWSGLRLGPAVPPGDRPPSRGTAVADRTRALALAEDLPTGTVVAERYRIDARVGRGPVSTRYRGEHVHTGRRVAIKVLSRDSCGDPTVVQRFRGEARAATACGHPSIIEVLDAGELDDGRLFMVTELLTGPSLRDEVARRGALDVATACCVLREVAEAVLAAHRAGVIHRDLTPDNVVLAAPIDRGPVRLKVVDFGVSAWWGTGAKRLTLPGRALGTPQYMAPEQAYGEEATPRFDVYALGVMAHELLVGTPPFHGESLTEITRNKHRLPAPSLGSRRDGLPGRLVALIDQCLKRDPARRPVDVQGVLSSLAAVITSLPEPSDAAERTQPVDPGDVDPEATVDRPAPPVAPLPARPEARPAPDAAPAAAGARRPAVRREPTAIQTALDPRPTSSRRSSTRSRGAVAPTREARLAVVGPGDARRRPDSPVAVVVPDRAALDLQAVEGGTASRPGPDLSRRPPSEAVGPVDGRAPVTESQPRPDPSRHEHEGDRFAPTAESPASIPAARDGREVSQFASTDQSPPSIGGFGQEALGGRAHPNGRLHPGASRDPRRASGRHPRGVSGRHPRGVSGRHPRGVSGRHPRGVSGRHLRSAGDRD